MKPSFKQIQELKAKYSDDVTLNLYKCSIVKICPYCDGLYVPTHFNQKYCTEECYKEHRREYKAEWKRTKYQPKPREKLGTGYLTEKRKQDFDKEKQTIKRELRRLRIR